MCVDSHGLGQSAPSKVDDSRHSLLRIACPQRDFEKTEALSCPIGPEVDVAGPGNVDLDDSRF